MRAVSRAVLPTAPVGVGGMDVGPGRPVLGQGSRSRGRAGRGGRPIKETASREVVNGRSSEDTAAKIKTSRAKVEAVRTIEDHADEYPDIKEAVLSGKQGIRTAARAAPAGARGEVSCLK